MSILVTGGAGFLGSRACVKLLQSGREAAFLITLEIANQKQSSGFNKSRVGGMSEFGEIFVSNQPSNNAMTTGTG
jgi:UDP-glucose 4-epimerase